MFQLLSPLSSRNSIGNCRCFFKWPLLPPPPPFLPPLLYRSQHLLLLNQSAAVAASLSLFQSFSVCFLLTHFVLVKKRLEPNYVVKWRRSQRAAAVVAFSPPLFPCSVLFCLCFVVVNQPAKQHCQYNVNCVIVTNSQTAAAAAAVATMFALFGRREKGEKEKYRHQFTQTSGLVWRLAPAVPLLVFSASKKSLFLSVSLSLFERGRCRYKHTQFAPSLDQPGQLKKALADNFNNLIAWQQQLLHVSECNFEK